MHEHQMRTMPKFFSKSSYRMSDISSSKGSYDFLLSLSRKLLSNKSNILRFCNFFSLLHNFTTFINNGAYFMKQNCNSIWYELLFRLTAMLWPIRIDCGQMARFHTNLAMIYVSDYHWTERFQVVHLYKKYCKTYPGYLWRFSVQILASGSGLEHWMWKKSTRCTAVMPDVCSSWLGMGQVSELHHFLYCYLSWTLKSFSFLRNFVISLSYTLSSQIYRKILLPSTRLIEKFWKICPDSHILRFQMH